ncbi:L,D-transpeptidase [Stappia sp. ES.058]|uniref:L,D-transpeptidase n=1 Tax=Stappia sp. ES.058 TaxID=1881061 RepID=UPI00087B8CF5|nr:L,D-transpeptidase [Stappia sp. ES.058]SDU38639.1 L,D-transpeptidase catalytic domain [Stappia sp. ES.058]
MITFNKLRRRLLAMTGPLLIVFAMGLAGADARASSLVARIDLSEQRMKVYLNGRHTATWRVSTARRGYRTPVGTFRPGRMHARYFSRKYHNSPMPHSVFFHGGYAIHGTTAIKSLGRPASHGCVRLHPDNARRLFSLIKQNGKRNARIVITR